MDIKKTIGITILGCLSVSAAAFASGSGQTSTVSISYYQTYSTGTTVPMYGIPATVKGYVNPTYSTNSCWYELHNSSGIYYQAEAQIGFNGTLYTTPYSVPTADYHLDLNPDGPNYDSVVANGTAQN